MAYKFLIPLIIYLFLSSCDNENINEVPIYIKIDSILLEENTSQNISDVWIYIDDILQGVYELPIEIPLLVEGKHKLRIKAGIRENGISATRIPFPFYTSYIIEEQNFTVEENITLNPVFNYIDNITVIKENFEGIGVNLESTLISDTTINLINAPNNNYGEGILNDSLITFEVATDEFNIDQLGPVFLELDYKSNTQFLVGIYANFPQSLVLQKDIIWITPKDEWNKIYINLSSTIQESNQAESFKVFIGMKRDFTKDTNWVNLDNITIIY
tara:strand:- start:3895 stop:4710 length:816 start_codon:yes stop_codon:yes gene_type:complete